MTRWSPDTCPCVVDVEAHPNGRDYVFVGWQKKCDLHENLEGQALVDALLQHNRKFNLDEKLKDDEKSQAKLQEYSARRVAKLKR